MADNIVTRVVDKIADRANAATKAIQQRREEYDSTWDKLTHPEWFDDKGGRTAVHPAVRAAAPKAGNQ
jgi:glutamate formiminotransferase